MRIDKVELFPVRMPLKGVLTLPRGASRSLEEGKRVVVVKMTGEDGTVGWGEAGPSRRWSAETLESCHSSLQHYLVPAVIGLDAFDLHGLHAAMNREIAPGLDPGQPIAKAAIDIAAHDLVCRALGIPLQAYLGGRGLDRIPLARLVSAATPEEAAEITKEGLAAGYEGFKVKTGRAPAHDIAVMEAVVEAAGGATGAVTVWPDANQGYELEDAIACARAFEAMGVSVFEQPVAMADIRAMKRLMEATSLTVVLDEAAMGLPFVLELIRRDAVEGLAIKVNKVGGLMNARQMGDLARNAGLRLIGSGLMDAPIGFAASVHLFAAYGIGFPADLNGPQFIAEDYLATPFPMAGQSALVPTAPGLGIEVDEAKLARFRLDQG